MKKSESLEDIYDEFMKSSKEKDQSEAKLVEEVKEEYESVEDNKLELEVDEDYNPLSTESLELNNSEEALQKEIFSDDNFNEIQKIIDENLKDEESNLEDALEKNIFENEQFSEVEKIIQDVENEKNSTGLEEEPNNKKKIVVAIIIILLLLLLFFVVFLFLNKKEDKKEIESTNSQSYNYEEIMERYGDKVTEQIELYYHEHQELPEELPTVEIEGYTIVCEGETIYAKDSIYLKECTINGSNEKYEYGEELEPVDNPIDTNTNTNSLSNSNTNTSTNKPTNSNTNTNKPTNSNKPSSTNSNKPSNTSTNKPTNTNTSTNKPTNTNTNTSSNTPTNTNTNTNTNINTNKDLMDVIKKDAQTNVTIDFTTDKKDGIFTTKENSKTIYYYRGNVDNNYVLFANACWRIVRTTSSDEIKIIYSGKTCSAKENDVLIGRIEYSKASSNKTVFTSSLIYKEIQTWYANNIKSYQSKLSKIDWCNDVTSTSYNRSIKGNPSLSCPSGAKKVSSYFGLLTVDEAVYAGSVLSKNRTRSVYNYLRIEQSAFTVASDPNFKNVLFATMSQGDSDSKIVDVGSNGEIESTAVNWNIKDYSWGSFGIRPVVSLKSGIQITKGEGTKSNPYVIEK